MATGPRRVVTGGHFPWRYVLSPHGCPKGRGVWACGIIPPSPGAAAPPPPRPGQEQQKHLGGSPSPCQLSPRLCCWQPWSHVSLQPRSPRPWDGTTEDKSPRGCAPQGRPCWRREGRRAGAFPGSGICPALRTSSGSSVPSGTRLHTQQYPAGRSSSRQRSRVCSELWLSGAKGRAGLSTALSLSSSKRMPGVWWASLQMCCRCPQLENSSAAIWVGAQPSAARSGVTVLPVAPVEGFAAPPPLPTQGFALGLCLTLEHLQRLDLKPK